MFSSRYSSACSGTDDCTKNVHLSGSRPEASQSVAISMVFWATNRIGVVGGEGVPIGDEVEAFVLRIVLQANPILQCAEVVADVQASGGTHAAEDALAVFGGVLRARHSRGPHGRGG